MCPIKKFGSLKPKDVKKASDDVVDPDPEIDVKKITEEAFEPNIYKDYYKAKEPTAAIGYMPGTVRLMTVFELITNKSFPRKGPGKSTKVKILDAIIMAAINKKLLLQEEKDAKIKRN